MSTRLVKFVMSVQENVADALYTVEWFATAIPVSHRKKLKKSVRRCLCGCKNWILTGSLPVPGRCQKC